MRSKVVTESADEFVLRRRMPPDVPVSDPDVEEQRVERQNTVAVVTFLILIAVVMSLGTIYIRSLP